MKGLLSLVLILSTAIAANAQSVEQKISPPEDGLKWYVSVFAAGDDAKLYDGWFASNDTLKKVKAQTHYQVYSPTSTMFKQRYAANTKVPSIRIQDHAGFVVREWKDKDVPKTAEALASEIASSIQSYQAPLTGPFRRPNCPDNCPDSCPMRRNPQPAPEPSPTPAEPDSNNGPPSIDDEPSSDWPPFWMVALAVIVGGVAGGVNWFKKQYPKK